VSYVLSLIKYKRKETIFSTYADSFSYGYGNNIGAEINIKTISYLTMIRGWRRGGYSLASIDLEITADNDFISTSNKISTTAELDYMGGYIIVEAPIGTNLKIKAFSMDNDFGIKAEYVDAYLNDNNKILIDSAEREIVIIDGQEGYEYYYDIGNEAG